MSPHRRLPPCHISSPFIVHVAPIVPSRLAHCHASTNALAHRMYFVECERNRITIRAPIKTSGRGHDVTTKHKANEALSSICDSEVDRNSTATICVDENVDLLLVTPYCRYEKLRCICVRCRPHGLQNYCNTILWSVSLVEEISCQTARFY